MAAWKIVCKTAVIGVPFQTPVNLILTAHPHPDSSVKSLISSEGRLGIQRDMKAESKCWAGLLI